jgi:hypothetical protein
VTRWASNTNQTQAAKPATYLVTLCELAFDSGTIRVHDGAGTLSFGGNDYLGIGTYGSFDIVDENIDNVARGIRLTLSGVDSSFISTMMTETYQGRTVTLYLGLIAEDMTFVDDPEELWSGRVDTMKISMDSNSAVISVSCEYRLRKEPVIARYTDTDQRLAYSGDRFFDLTQKIPQFRATWGDKPNSYAGGGYGGGNIPGNPLGDGFFQDR